jgi:RimJ/RimL family protein N-acetyltransferase
VVPWRGRLQDVLTVAPDALRPWFAPERPGPLVFEHVARTGHGRVRVDRWPDPRVVVAELPGNLAMRGDPEHLPPKELAELSGFVDAPPEWLPALRASDPRAAVWDRLIAVLPAAATVPSPAVDVRLLTPDDAPAFAALSADSAWIAQTWGGVGGLLAARVARGVLVDGQVAALAVPFYLGGRYEDIGVVTEPGMRRRGLSTACAAALVADIRGRGHVPTWSTSPDNTGSRGVAERLGFVHERDDVLYALRTPIPTS